MAKKSVAIELERILRSLPNMDAEEQELATERLNTLGIDTPGGPIRRPGVICPFTQMQVVSPCSLTECQYHIENDWSRNCLLEYLEVQGSESLASEEIAFLYNVSTEHVDSEITKGMSQLRENSEETVGFSGGFERPVKQTITANVAAEDEFTITATTLSPPFMKDVNSALEIAIPADAVFPHPAIRLLGVLDTIISELE
jgi:hypothetical protein